MNIKILAVGSLKEKYWKEASEEYSRRIGRYCGLQIREIKESP